MSASEARSGPSRALSGGSSSVPSRPSSDSKSRRQDSRAAFRPSSAAPPATVSAASGSSANRVRQCAEAFPHRRKKGERSAEKRDDALKRTSAGQASERLLRHGVEDRAGGRLRSCAAPRCPSDRGASHLRRRARWHSRRPARRGEPSAVTVKKHVFDCGGSEIKTETRHDLSAEETVNARYAERGAPLPAGTRSTAVMMMSAQYRANPSAFPPADILSKIRK